MQDMQAHEQPSTDVKKYQPLNFGSDGITILISARGRGSILRALTLTSIPNYKKPRSCEQWLSLHRGLGFGLAGVGCHRVEIGNRPSHLRKERKKKQDIKVESRLI